MTVTGHRLKPLPVAGFGGIISDENDCTVFPANILCTGTMTFRDGNISLQTDLDGTFNHIFATFCKQPLSDIRYSKQRGFIL